MVLLLEFSHIHSSETFKVIIDTISENFSSYYVLAVGF